MFKFNFMDGDVEGESPDGDSPKQEVQPQCRPCKEISVDSRDKGMCESVQFHEFKVSVDIVLWKAVNPVTDLPFGAAAGSALETDLIPGEYEGGYKVWECSTDLCRYIASNANFPGKRVIELGCGQGLVGITAFAVGAEEVHFQDYDEAVIENLTVPAVMRNLLDMEKKVSTKEQVIGARFFAGDWGTMGRDILAPLGLVNQYDVVLTTETIYSEHSSIRLLNCIKSCMKRDGICLLAAKSFYFGVGGGVRGFQNIVELDGTLCYRSLLVIDDGKSNRREILELKFKEIK
jgi:SAM-dependent methyltransferase